MTYHSSETYDKHDYTDTVYRDDTRVFEVGLYRLLTEKGFSDTSTTFTSNVRYW